MKTEAEFNELLNESTEKKAKTPVIGKIVYIYCLLMALYVVFEIPIKIWVLPVLKGEEITKDFYKDINLTIIYPKEYVRVRNGHQDFRFSNKNNGSFFRLRTKTADEKTFSERAEKHINDVIRINNGYGANYEETIEISPDIAYYVKDEETISLGSTEEIKVGEEDAVLVIFKGTEYYIAAVIIDYLNYKVCLLEFVLTPDENNEQMIRDILITLEVVSKSI